MGRIQAHSAIGARGAILASCRFRSNRHAVLLADRTRDVRTITTVVTEVLAANPETTPVIVGNSIRLASEVESGDALG
jgi:hypothetical protein